jgi:hypothetical protein
MAKYDLEWKQLAEWRASLKAEQENKPETKIIIVESFNDKESKPTPEEVAQRSRKGMPHRNKPRKKVMPSEK